MGEAAIYVSEELPYTMRVSSELSGLESLKVSLWLFLSPESGGSRGRVTRYVIHHRPLKL
jgi:hypothetical protein